MAPGPELRDTLGERGCCEAAADLCFDSAVSTDKRLLQDRLCPFLLIYRDGEAGLICFRAGNGHEASIMVSDKGQYLWPGGTGLKWDLVSSRAVINPTARSGQTKLKKRQSLDLVIA